VAASARFLSTWADLIDMTAHQVRTLRYAECSCCMMHELWLILMRCGMKQMAHADDGTQNIESVNVAILRQEQMEVRLIA